MKHLYFFFFLFSSIAFTQIPSNYYDSANGLSGYTLKTQLKTIITTGHIDQGYNLLLTGYQTTDNDSFYENDNSVLDMYSENPTGADTYNFAHDTNGGTPPGQACGNYTIEGDCYNREHIFPQGFFNEELPMRSDIHHVVPTDGRVNGFRGNYPFGEVGTNLISQSNITNPTKNGSKLGNCISPGYSGTVFEPIDEFKGDIARMLLYFAVRYEDEVASNTWDAHDSTSENPLNGTNNQVYETWYINLLYKWHTEDPVSTRELSRNNAAYNYQGNANPFIDHPEYVQSIWGSVLSTNKFQSIFDITIYPNPLKGNKLNISSTNTSPILSIEILNVLGKSVFKQKLSNNASEINISSLNKGIYLVRLKSEKGSITKKLIKQ